MKKIILSAENIIMKFGGVTAIDNLSMNVREKEIVALIGPNGAGKTTAFNVITGVYSPTSGCVKFNSQTIVSSKNTLSLDKITKTGIARTFQNIRLFKNLTVFENVLIATHMRSKANFLSATFRLNYKEEAHNKRATMELLEKVGLASLKDEIASSLPYGKQRRLEIARALATRPTLLLLDEPAAGMNPQETEELTEFISQIKEDFNLSILMIEHHMDLIMEISDRIYVLDFGKLIAEGKPTEIQNNQKVIDAYLGVQDE
ncbi:ABC transporter ATP-binding protein [Fusobacterium sp. PH5-44]|uniref:ABC transporter ATP-binding protein n=1 Tax=unclassified Fusobacterium TaxID=2648384 RepID=UPI003D19ECE7